MRKKIAVLLLIVAINVVIFFLVVGCQPPADTKLIDQATQKPKIFVGGMDYYRYEFVDKEKGGTFVFFVRLNELDGVVFVPFE